MEKEFSDISAHDVWREIHSGNLERLEKLLNLYEIPLDSSGIDYDLLNEAIQKQRSDIVRLLVREGCRVNVPINHQTSTTPLHQAAALNNEEIVDILLENGAAVTAQIANGDTPIHKATRSNNEKIIDLLLSKLVAKEYSNIVNNVGLSHMHVACMGNDPNIVQYFINNGVDINSYVQFNSQEWPGYSPLHFAVEYNKIATVQLLLENKALVDAKEARQLTPLNLLCRQSFERICNMMDTYLSSKVNKEVNLKILSEAEQITMIEQIVNQKIQIEILSLLLMYNSDINSMDKFDRTPLVNTCQKIDPVIKSVIEYHPWLLGGVLKHFNSRRKEIIKVLLSFNADINIRYNEDETILHLISDFDFDDFQDEVVKLFLNKGIDVNVKNKYNETPLLIATRHENIGLVKTLLDNNADVNASESLNQSTPLHIATTYKCGRIIELLIDYGANLNARQWDGKTPLHTLQIAIGHLDEEIVTEDFYGNIVGRFADQNCDINVRDVNDITPLHFACQEGNSEGAFILLEFGADINTEDSIKRTPLYYGINECFSVLVNHIEKLMCANLFVSPKNIYLRSVLIEKSGKTREDDFMNCCEYELHKLKSIKIDSYTSLYSIMFKDENEMSLHIENERFKSLIDSEKLKEEYPLYSYLLQVQFKKGKLRKFLLQPAKESLESLIRIGLPDSCSENIFKYLCNEYLEDLIEARL